MKCYVKYTKEDGRRLYVEFNRKKLHFELDYDEYAELYNLKMTPTMLETIMKLINGAGKK